MTAAFVVDCSLAMTWVFPDEATAESTHLLHRLASESALVPAHWFLEVVNVLAMAEKRGRISAPQSAQFLRMLDILQFEIDHEAAALGFSRILPLSRTYKLTSYDAAYLELAHRRQLPLATLDDDLRSSATALGVQLLGK